MEKCKVAVILPYFGNGGAEHMVSRYVSNLDLRKMDVHVFCVLGEYLDNDLEKCVIDNGIEISYVGKEPGFSLKAMIKLGKMLSKYNPNVVHTHLSALVYSAPWIISHRKVRAFHTLHTIPKEENRRVLRRWISKTLIKTGRITPIAISKANYELISEYYKISMDKVALIYNSVETVKYFRCKTDKEHFVYVTVGRLTKVKNQRLLIDAFCEVLKRHGDKVSLWIVGNGELEAELKEYVFNLGIDKNIRFWGYCSEVEAILAEADVFVLSSDFEGLPLCVLEAMAAELPVVSTNVGGISDIVTDNGILVECGNKKKLADAMNTFVDDYEVWKKYSEASRKNAEQFDIKYNVQKCEKLYLNNI